MTAEHAHAGHDHAGHDHGAHGGHGHAHVPATFDCAFVVGVALNVTFVAATRAQESSAAV